MTLVICLINQSKEIGEHQFSVLGFRGDQIGPLTHVAPKVYTKIAMKYNYFQCNKIHHSGSKGDVENQGQSLGFSISLSGCKEDEPSTGGQSPAFEHMEGKALSVVSFICCLVLLQSRKTCPNMTKKLLTGM